MVYSYRQETASSRLMAQEQAICVLSQIEEVREILPFRLSRDSMAPHSTSHIPPFVKR